MVYEITEYSLIGKIINIFRERPDLKVVHGEHGQPDTYVDEDGVKVVQNFRSELTTRLEDYKGSKGGVVDLLNADEFPIFLPFFADVTADLPTSARKIGVIPDTYKNCQLLTQKHGGYLEFFHHETETTHRIAMNSNTYKPVK